MADQPQGFHRSCGDHCRTISYSDDAVDGAPLRSLQNRGDRSRFVVEPNSQGLVLPGVLEHVAAVGGKKQVDTESFSGFTERARLVTGRRGEE